MLKKNLLLVVGLFCYFITFPFVANSFNCGSECAGAKDYGLCVSQCNARYKNMEELNKRNNTDFAKKTGQSGGQENNSCFIATAAFGSGDDESVRILRQYRDNILLKSEYGQNFVKEYYKYSPYIADYISDKENIKYLTRIALTPFVHYAETRLSEDRNEHLIP